MFEITVWPIADADRGGCVVVFIYTSPPFLSFFLSFFFLQKKQKILTRLF